jgi:hypothetical protein
LTPFAKDASLLPLKFFLLHGPVAQWASTSIIDAMQIKLGAKWQIAFLKADWQI